MVEMVSEAPTGGCNHHCNQDDDLKLRTTSPRWLEMAGSWPRETTHMAATQLKLATEPSDDSGSCKLWPAVWRSEALLKAKNWASLVDGGAGVCEPFPRGITSSK